MASGEKKPANLNQELPLNADTPSTSRSDRGEASRKRVITRYMYRYPREDREKSNPVSENQRPHTPNTQASVNKESNCVIIT